MTSRLLLGIGLLCLPFTGTLAAAFPDDPLYHSSGSWGQAFEDQWAVRHLRVYSEVARADGEPASEAAPVVVAVIDTGLDYRHADFATERLWQNPGERRNGRDDDGNGYVDDLIGWNFVDGSNNPWDESGHGTHIVGLIAACTNNGVGISGLDEHALIMPLKVANFAGQARSSAVAAAIYYATDHGARIINLSLGGELATDLEHEAARYAAANNVLIVVSAGNRGVRTATAGYSTLPEVLVVGASDLDGSRAGFSNFGAELELLAPGVDLLSLRARDTDFILLSEPLDYPEGAAFVGEGDEYYRASGTSFSAAVVSGLAAGLLARRPELDRTGLRRVLLQSASDVGANGVDQLAGYGEVDFVHALAADSSAYVEARLTGVDLELRDKQIWIHVTGTAAADQVASAALMVRAAPGSVPEPEADADTRKNKKKKKKKKKKGKDEPEPPSPYDWQMLAGELATPVETAVLGSVELESLIGRFGGATSWELELRVSTSDGRSRVSRLAMALPLPQTPVLAEAERRE